MIVADVPVVRRDPQVHVQVARLAATRAGRAATGETQRGAAVDTGRHVDLVGLVDRDPTLAAAGRARRGDHLTHAAAATARTRGDHLPEQALAHPLHLTAPVALAARDRLRAVAGAGSATVGAGDRQLQADVDLITEHRLLEGDVDDDLESCPRGGPAGPRPAAAERAAAAAEERLEDVAEATAEQVLGRRTARPLPRTPASP